MVDIPCYSVAASAGQGQTVTDESQTDVMRVNKEWLRDLGLQNAKLAVIQSSGDSMLPTIPVGAPLLVDLGVNCYMQAGLYVFRRGDELSVKRLSQDVITGNITVASDNSLYPTVNLTPEQAEDLNIIGQVRLVMSKY
ncbi:S24 family peptidase [Ferrimonas senticii]|uniref:S24 family peptidase n=1 Tax=Ferrimonas senticii TaxID=394566 RepID=UPI0003FD1EE5|nr:S24 family peptidase [Ferrimonas senticii]